MQTDDVRSLVKTAATGMPGAKLWSNGLGFDLRGTSYRINERLSRASGSVVWEASRRFEYATKYGEGATPQAAKRAAGIGRDKHTKGNGDLQ
jgi:hypothetical protein